MEEERRRSRSLGMGGHVLALPYPSQGHINPMLHFCKRLVSNGLKATLAVTTFIRNNNNNNNTGLQHPISHSVQLETISDGYDEGGFTQASSIEAYLTRLESSGSQTLAQLIQRYATSDHPFDCVVYDAFLPWALDVTKQLGLVAACFFTQACSVNYIYYQVHHGLLTLPIPASSLPLQSFPGLPLLQLQDMPSFIYVYGSYPAYFHLVKNQYRNADKADYVFVNTFYKLEEKVVDTMSKVSPVLTIGPAIPSFYLDNRIENDRDYGLDLFHADQSSTCSDWLSSKPKGSVVYVSFGSMAGLAHQQMEELAWGIQGSGYCFLWVARASEEAKLPRKFMEETSEKGLVVQWSPQLEVLSSEAVGCFFSHCGWNSTMEALSLGVAMVVMPQWTDQTTNAKLVQDVWKVGLRVRVDEKGIVGREEIEASIREVMEGERGKEMKKNAVMWRELGREAVSEGGTSDMNIRKFVSEFTN